MDSTKAGISLVKQDYVDKVIDVDDATNTSIN